MTRNAGNKMGISCRYYRLCRFTKFRDVIRYLSTSYSDYCILHRISLLHPLIFSYAPDPRNLNVAVFLFAVGIHFNTFFGSLFSFIVLDADHTRTHSELKENIIFLKFFKTYCVIFINNYLAFFYSNSWCHLLVGRRIY